MEETLKCAVKGCENVNNFSDNFAEFHRKSLYKFPTDSFLYDKLLERITHPNLKQDVEKNNYRDCAELFVTGDFTEPLLRSGRRKRNAAIASLKLDAATEDAGAGDVSGERGGIAGKVIKREEEEGRKDCDVENVKQELTRQFWEEENIELLLVTEIEAEAKIKNKSIGKRQNRSKKSFESNGCTDFHLKGICDNNSTCVSCPKDFALELYKKSPKIYKILQDRFDLPQTLSLYKWKIEKETQ